MLRRCVLLVCLVALIASAAGAQTMLNGAGATFPYPIYSKWFSEYHKLHPEISINYQSIGSGGGIKQVLVGTVDFGASDGPMTDDQLSQAKVKILHIPTVLGSVVPAYNVPSVKGELRFTGPILAGIFLGRITTWNDPMIAKANPGVSLPGDRIVVVHRSDGSGTSSSSPITSPRSARTGTAMLALTRRSVADWLGRERQRGRSGPGTANARFHRLRRTDLRGQNSI